ncbi:O-methyltransferase [Saccharopolyspora sp. MS10]|uniref:O-methyltransferase n=1 Tax=Saccharopolyspora sp. MS10 TaxID=3385973 RepID=UPI0039A19878
MHELIKTTEITPQVNAYMAEQSPPLSDAQQWLINRTTELGDLAEMQIPREQGALFTLITRITGAKHVVEVGTFTGYSALAFALGLPSGGKVVTCDITDEWLPIAQRAWTEADVADRIEFRHGPAVDTLGDLDDTFDIAFLDADKPSYVDYWELVVPRVRPGGLILSDNVLYYGEAADPNATGNGAAIRAFNAHVLADDRVTSVLLPIAYGLTIALKK